MKSLNGTGITISGSGQRQKAKVRQSYIDGFAQFLADSLPREDDAKS
jgi:hypothetical protein